ncbi:DUF3631 domain-containing protein [Streptomyces sp. NPDC006798]|uniref:DUF3631 domain-containing protein n=1 Tax=Streptomyces sp. NPDC006798 TaxID=3155462 RepID=UPI0033C96458
MTTPFLFPTVLDHLAAALLKTELPPETPRHRAILDTFLEVQQLDEQLLGPGSPLDDTLTSTQRNELADLLVERLAAGQELALLLSAETSAFTGDAEGDVPADEPDEPDEDEAGSILHTVLGVFAGRGDPDALASTDLVDALRVLPGIAEGRWRYADLTSARLARLLAPYEVKPRDITLPDGRRRKAYRRAALLAATER